MKMRHIFLDLVGKTTIILEKAMALPYRFERRYP